jgi:tetratricopeptide (TPR) repeat protein
MAQPTPPARPDLAGLFTEYLLKQAEAQAQGLGYADLPGGMEPHDATPVQPVDPQLAWTDALAAARFFSAALPRGGSVPPDWPVLVGTQEPAYYLAFALGNFPQLVRNLHPLLSGEPLALFTSSEPAAVTDLTGWAARQSGYPKVLLAAGVLRLARHFDEAAQLLEAEAPAGWEPARQNELAALVWHQGKAEQALALWRQQPNSVPVLFNRGMAALFLGHKDEARAALAQAVAGLPETSAWYHLGQLYLALA